MSMTLLTSIVLRALALGWSLLLLWRLKNWRMGFFSVMLGLMAMRQTFTLIGNGFDGGVSFSSNPDELPGLIVSLLALSAVYFLGKMLIDQQKGEDIRRIQLRAMDASVNGILIADALQPDQPIIYCNPAFETITGYPVEEVVGRNCRFLQGCDNQQTELDAIRSGLLEGVPVRSVLRNYRKDGAMFWNELFISPVNNDAGHITHFVGIQTDITQYKQIENERKVREGRLLSQQCALHDISRQHDIVHDDLNAFLHKTTETIAETLKVSRVSIWLFQDNAKRIQCIDLYEREQNRHTHGNELTASQYPVYFQYLKESRVIAADNACEDPRTSEFTEDYLIPLGITAMLDATIRRSGKCIGVVCHETITISRHWTTDEQVFAGAVADQVSLALELSDLVNAQDQLQRNQELLEHRVKQRTVELQASEERYRDLFENAHDLIQSIRPDGTIDYVNRAWLDAMGYTADELVNLNMFDLLHPECRAHCQTIMKEVLAGGLIDNFETQFVTKDGRTLFLEGNSSCRFEQGKPVTTRGFFRDVTSRKEAEFALLAEQERAQVTLASIGDAVITTNADAVVDYLNPIAEIFTGWPLIEAKGQPLANIFKIYHEQSREPAPDPVERCLIEGKITGQANQTVLINRAGKEFAIEDSAAPIRDSTGNIFGVVLVFHDVSEQRRLTREITHEASHDVLTGLINRREFERRLQHLLDGLHDAPVEHALCFMDLDRFKIVNDTCGHAAGDELLRQVTKLFESNVRYQDSLARLGGDEFGLLLEHCNSDQAERIANVIRKAVEDYRFTWSDKIFHIGISIGLVPIGMTSSGIESLMKSADRACYAAKDSGRNQVYIYHEDDVDLVHRHGELQWVSRIQNALENNHFQLYAQPIVPIDHDSDESHYELLLRLHDDEGELITPGVFMQAAERYQLVQQIDRWVIQHAFSWLVEHTMSQQHIYRCAINLSGHSVGDRKFEEFLIQELNKTGLPGDLICFEITETAAIANLTEANRFIKNLKTKGCRFALDDFGSGSSSFAYLKNLPVDYLKIDGIFVKDILTDPIDLAMVRSINEIGQLMGKQTIAECVETQTILDELQKLGVNYAQGYSVGYPVPLKEITKTVVA